MVFSSVEFLCIFLPGVLLGYYILPKRARNIWLLLASLAFYACGGPQHLIYLLFIYYYKGVLSIGDIQTLFAPIREITKKEGGMELADIYDEVFHSLCLESAKFLTEHLSCLCMITGHVSDEDIVKTIV